MTSRYSIKGISAGISLIGLLAVTMVMADITLEDGKVDPGKGELPEKQSSEETKKLVLEDLSHADLVKYLADEDFTIREKTSNLVWHRGKPILKTLEDALLTKNPELISRANELIRYIKVGISPDTPPHVAKMVHAFADADNDEKEDILRELYAEKAYSQMLFMLSEMDDRALAHNLYENFNRLGHQAAKESIGKGDIEAAIEQLKLIPKNETSMRSLAYLYAHLGRLDAELEKLNQMSDQLVDKKWKNHLNLEKPNREDIRKFSQQENLTGVIAILDMLEGDPTLMYKYHSQKAPLTAKTGLAILMSQYECNNSDFIQKAHTQQEQILELSKANRSSDLLNQTMKSMCLTGAGRLVEPYMLKKHQYEAFSYLQRREQPKKALEIIGITDADSLKKFIKENTQLALDETELEQEDIRQFRGEEQIPYSTRLVLVADFYYSKGQYQTAKAVITPLLKAFQAQENKEWYQVVESIAHQGMYDLAIELVLGRGNDEDTYKQMVTYLYDDTAETDLIWNTLLERNGVKPDKSFRDLAVIMGVYQSEIKTYLQLQRNLEKIATKKGVDDLYEMRIALYSVAMYRQDAISSKRYAKQLLDDEKNKALMPIRKLEYLRALSNSLDWKGIVTLLDKDTTFIHNSAKWFALYSVAKRKLGDLDAADRLLSHAKLVSLGLNDELRDIALEHYLAGYYDISTQIIERILIVGSVDRESNLYQFAFGYLSGSDNAYIHTQQWSKAAAFFMVKSAADLVAHPMNSESVNIGYYINDFYNAQFARGMELYQAGEKAKGLKLLTLAHEAIVGDGSLADHFYPAIRTTGLVAQYDQWVGASYKYLKRSINEFPKCANTHNTLAWLLSRSVRKIDEGIKHSEESLRLTPFEASYIDTMGELHHAKGDRKNAIKWGEKAVMASKYGSLDALGRRSSAKMRTYSLSNQLERFRTEPTPSANPTPKSITKP